MIHLIASTAAFWLQAVDESIPASWWVILIVALTVVVFGVIWFLYEESKEKEVASKVTAVSPPAAAPSEPDDLTRIEGIGPQISLILQNAGITTFAQLASQNAEHLYQIMQAANLRIANPETWPEQAALAMRGDWAALETLQATLKGGRRA